MNLHILMKQREDALKDAIRALRDIAGLDPERPNVSLAEKVAERSLARIAIELGESSITQPGHTPRPDEFFPGVDG